MNGWLDSVRSGLTSRPDHLNGYVHVLCPIGECSFSLCTADVFDTDTLTITVIEDGMELRTFKPGSWLEATAYDSRGNVLFAFISAPGRQRKERLAS